ncbi:hypothetical protein OQJ46_11795 [Microbulbifer thermotolerans]|uniref:hypothetical protein n=1 Tax=Microbulbifer thermotolerans TaxID=252514 RepID=UPI00224A701D|nr:hypothetical protein [Microbulbifer thermotolerans]MCX2783668.1 hypothetical protein [Microbulbifer thermotolerans]
MNHQQVQKYQKIVDSYFGYTASALRDFITAPEFKREADKVCIYFAMEGYFVEIFMPGFTHGQRARMNIIERKKTTVFFHIWRLRIIYFYLKFAVYKAKKITQKIAPLHCAGPLCRSAFYVGVTLLWRY